MTKAKTFWGTHSGVTRQREEWKVEHPSARLVRDAWPISSKAGPPLGLDEPTWELTIEYEP